MMVSSKDIERGTMKQDLKGINTDTSKNSRNIESMVKRGREWGIKLWLGYSLWVIVALSIQLVLGSGSWAFPDTLEGQLACDTESPDQNKNMCLLSKSLNDGVDTLRTLSAFVLGGYVVGSVNLWLKRRTAYCALCGSARNLLINVCSIAPADRNKKLLSRWAILGYELAVLKGRGLIDHDEGKIYLNLLNLLHGDEWDTMVDGDRHTTVWFWIQAKSRMLFENGDIDGLQFQTICQAVTLSRDRANDLMSCINLDQPAPYTFVCGLLININLLLLSVASGFEWSIWQHETHGKIWMEPRMYIEIFILFLNTAITSMLFDLCTILYNPFGGRKIDIMHYQVGAGIRKLAKSLSKSPLPSTINSDESSGNFNLTFKEDDSAVLSADSRLGQKVIQPKQMVLPRGELINKASLKSRFRAAAKTATAFDVS